MKNVNDARGLCIATIARVMTVGQAGVVVLEASI
jgi:hypothetical protein